MPGFTRALEIGVDVIELDVALTADGQVVLNHDQVLSEVTARDTGPARPGDPLFPYVGRRIDELTLEQVGTVDVGIRRAADTDPLMITQLPVPGTRPPTLAEVCALVRGAGHVGAAVELKTDPGWPDAEVSRFVAAVGAVLEAQGLVGRSRLLAFDWRVLTEARRLVPDAGLVALVKPETLVPNSGWIGALEGDPEHAYVAVAEALGATTLSPELSLATPKLIRHAHEFGLPVTVWTVNEPDTMAGLVGEGVDAIVTDYPDRLRAVLAGQGLPLPVRHRASRPLPAR